MLSANQINLFTQDGFMALSPFASPADTAVIRSTCNRLLAEQVGREAGDHFDLSGQSKNLKMAALPQIMNPSKYVPELSELGYRRQACSLAELLLGPDITLLNEHMIMKPAFHGGQTPWHQDQAYHDPGLIYTNVNIWLALADATIENGCMQYVPGSHKMDVLPHHPIGHNPQAVGLEVDQPQQYAAQAKVCPVSAGGVVVHRSYMLHYAGPNQTDRCRPAYVLVYGCEPRRRARSLNFSWLTGRHDGVKTS
ncbi:MAG: hypothetical protein CMJ20_02225 [Phycisphaeraceae bacterium]|nr:hypothetical protein [Phycisphaeraceae bacterium]|tara:strand:+ start:1758 stop:2513 length:756 start_codon:yes stop_codon:yes gene_type:complete